MSIKRYRPDQIETLLSRTEVLHLTARFDPLFIPTTVLVLRQSIRKVTHIEQTRPETFPTFARFEFPIGSFWVDC
jgi:hypothetical protein